MGPERQMIPTEALQMRVLTSYAVAFSVALASLNGCSGTQPPIGSPGVMVQTTSDSDEVRE